jgi:hypothetical protein
VRALFGQVKKASLLALHEGDRRAIGGFLVGLPVQSHADREAAGGVISNNLDATYRFASRPLANGFEALFSKGPIAHSNCFRLRHAWDLYRRRRTFGPKNDRRSRVDATVKVMGRKPRRGK